MENGEAQGALVIDVPSELTAEAATALLNEQYQRGYHIHRAVERFGGARIFLVATAKAKAGQTSQSPEDRAVQFIRENLGMSTPQLCAALKALKFVRSPKWVRAKVLDIIHANRKIR